MKDNSELSLAALTLGAAIGAFALMECLLTQLLLSTDVWQFRANVVWFMIPGLVLLLTPVMSVTKPSFLIVLGAQALALLSAMHFRGSYIWAGTFDLIHGSILPLASSLFLGIGGAALLGRFVKFGLPWAIGCSAFSLIGGLAWQWYFAPGFPDLVTMFPGTRHFAVLGVTVLTAAAVLVGGFE